MKHKKNEYLARIANRLVVYKAMAQYAVLAEPMMEALPAEVLAPIEEHVKWIMEDLDNRFDPELAGLQETVTRFLEGLCPQASFTVEEKPR